ncbi:hypothetical protein RV01_GL001970 [Enterococcus dispar]|nr:hypothetical protein RV01_GL001970 [Enterococcus dispar]
MPSESHEIIYKRGVTKDLSHLFFANKRFFKNNFFFFEADRFCYNRK